jgi:glycosyltransferase involved in cell wall biosynthesis
MMKVCHITTVHQPFDDRVFFKQCASLAAAGFDTKLVAPIASPTRERGVDIIPVRVPGGRFQRALVAGWRAWRIARALRADVYQVHDPELLWVALLLKRRSNAVVYDMHESMREHILTKSWIGPRWLRRMAAAVYGWFEDRVVRRCDAVLVVVDHMREDLLRRHPGAEDRIHVVRNLPVLAVIDRVLKPRERPQRFTMVYAGGLSEVRGIYEVVQAIGEVPEARLELIGPWSDDAYRERCMALPGWAQVTEHGRLRMDEVYDHLRAAHLGVCILYPIHNYMISAPVKSYEYMACRLPLLMSDFPAWRAAYGPYAWFIDPHDPKAIADTLRRIIADADGRERKGIAGRAAVEKGLSWERESERLIDLYRRIAP